MPDIPKIDAALLGKLTKDGVRFVLLACDGSPRDAFVLTVTVPAWNTGVSIKTNVRSGTMVTFTDAEKIDTSSLEGQKQTLANLNIYPLGDMAGDGDNFSARPLNEFQKWFSNRHAITPQNPQEPLEHLRRLDRSLMTQKARAELTRHLADAMPLLKAPGSPEIFIINSREQRLSIAGSIIDGLAQSMRYTRFEPNKGFYKAFRFEVPVQIKGTSIIVGGNTGRYAVLRPDGDVTPLDIDRAHSPTDMTYVCISPGDIKGTVSASALRKAIGPTP
jgi:hypothetical protein